MLSVHLYVVVIKILIVQVNKKQVHFLTASLVRSRLLLLRQINGALVGKVGKTE